jgi:DNA-binding SARP family transcriptional activator/tetratricopeptide (TPR) repeat protein
MGDAYVERRSRAAQFAFRVLGSLEVFGAAGPVGIPPGRQESVLAALLLDPGRVVRTDYLVHLLWDEDPPDTARTQVQICVSRIRKALTTAGMDATIVTRSPGYVLQIDETELDLTVFRRHVAEARVLVKEGRAAEAAEGLRSAVGLWRGLCLSGISSRVLERKGQQIDEERLAVTETFLKLELDLGRHHQLVPEIGRLVDEHPLRDRLRGQLMLALYRSGRQAEALEVYRAGRTLLQDELGLGPSSDLRLLEHAILADDPALALPAGPAAPLRPGGAPEPYHSPAAAVPDRLTEIEPHGRETTPHQLPADTADFVGDNAVLHRVESVLTSTDPGRAMGIVVIVGRPGIGKSTLATHIAHRLSDEIFPDGQLYCDLRGARADPVGAREVLGRFLRALGIPGPMIPDALDERAEMYRSMLATRRMLVVLDDAAGEAQITPLLPGAKSCGVLVTSRARLTGLPGAHRIALDILDTDRSLELVGKVIGPERVAAEVEAAKALTRAVGGLPLALRIVAARIAARPHWSLAFMVQRLADERRRLDELAHGEMTMRASLSLTYDGLAATDQQLLRLLSLAQGSTFPAWLSGALLDDPGPYPSDLLEPLVDVQMLDVVGVESTGELRYRFHEIIRLFARERLTEEVGPQEQRAALRRMTGGWLALVTKATRMVFATDNLRGTAELWNPPDRHVQDLLATPLEWMDGERENLSLAVELAAQQGEDELAWELAVALAPFYEARGYLDHWVRTHRKALSAVRQAGNRRGQAALLGSLGTMHLDRRQIAESQAALRESLAIFEELAESKGLAACRRDLALLERIRGDDDRALLLYEQAGRDFERSEDEVGRASVLTQSADILLRQGRVLEVQAQLQEALEIYRAAGYRGGQARALRRVGQVHLQRGEPERAEAIMSDVLGMVRESGDVIGEAHLLHDLARTYTLMGRLEQAESLLTMSLSIREGILDRSGVASVRLDLAALLIRLGERTRARGLLEEAEVTLRGEGMVRELRRAEELLASLTVADTKNS